MLKYGWLLFVMGMLFTVGGAFYIASSEAALDFLEPYYCEEGESLIQTNRYDPYDNSTIINFFCEGADGARRSADWQFFLTILLLMAPLGVSLILIILGSIQQANAKKKNAEGLVFGTGVVYRKEDGPIDVSGQAEDHSLDASEIKDLIKEALQQNNLNVHPPQQELTLKQKLEQLRDAYNAGVLTYDEYERNKERILQDFAEE
ncbi:SHOCT domain-containing protein [Phototrophicus methaneseepsis]|uniref:SHOCT domain-containing protein n=1 Tax=Phototrophicus methaneseepsis TaxID=2710758 RepID=A0A7S8E9P5_9CHLR|nr:SHOCT domain-containing protein [Phototrophicus methaneseepsis]QPC82983.1 SHOCT domain-containing protein [Phototrophicus methaneseepsis]